MKPKMIYMYEVRYYPGVMTDSVMVGRGRLVNYRKAQAIVRRLKKSGIMAIIGGRYRTNPIGLRKL